MLTEFFAFLARPEDYRAVWRDGELTVEALADIERQNAGAAPTADFAKDWQPPLPDARDGLSAIA